MHMATNVVQVRGLVRHHPKHGPRDAGQLGRTCGAKGPGEEIAADGRSAVSLAPEHATPVEPSGTAGERAHPSVDGVRSAMRALAGVIARHSAGHGGPLGRAD